MKVQIKDDVLRKFAGVTNLVSLKASGSLVAGTYTANTVPVTVPAGTKFTIDVTVPVRGSDEINCALAAGSLSTSQALTIMGVPAPLMIQLQNGSASANVDLGRTLVTLVLNALQNVPGAFAQKQPALEHQLSAIIDDVDVESADFQLQDGALLNFPFAQATIGPQSKLQFTKIHFDKQLNYKGNCLFDLTLPSLKFIDSKVGRTIQFDSVKLKMLVAAAKAGGVLSLMLPAPEQHAFRAAKTKSADQSEVLTCASSSFKLDKAEFKRTLGEAPSEISILGTVDVSDSDFDVHQNRVRVTAHLPKSTTASFSFDDKSGVPIYSLLAGHLSAENIALKAQSAGSSFDINLRQALINKLSLTRTEGLTVGFDKAMAEPNTAHVVSGKRTLSLHFAPGSAVGLAAFRFDKQSSSQMSAKIPVAVHSGGLHLETQEGAFDIDGLDGNLLVSLDNQNISSDGKFSLNVLSTKNDLGVTGAHGSIKNLNIHTDAKKLCLDIPDCRLNIPVDQLRQTIVANLPNKRVFDVNKNIYEGQKWRYRNFKLLKVIISQPSLTKLVPFESGKSDQFTFSGSGNVAANGTVEKLELHPLRPGKPVNWVVLPWRAAGHVNGSGDVSIKFLPGANLAESQIQYKASCKLGIPEKLAVDWSAVSGDILGKAERSLIEQAIKNAHYFTPEQGIPLESTGVVRPFDAKKTRLRQIKVRNFKVVPSESGITINLSATATL